MATKVVVLGAGPGGYVAAVRAAQRGADVTVIESDKLGGTCLNRGCIPSKVLITTAELLEKFHRAEAYGIRTDGHVQVNMQRLMARKAAVVGTQIKGIGALFKHHRIRLVQGYGRIAAHGRLAVTAANGRTVEVPWDRLILATGTRPMEIPALAFDGRDILSSDHALNLEQVPASILIVGGGVIGCEFACLLAALGSRVTVVEALARLLPLPSVDADCSKVLQREMKKRKIKFFVDRSVQRVDRADGKLQVTIGPSPFSETPAEKAKPPLTLAVDKVLVCVGRTANTDAIGLEHIGLKTDARGWIEADAHMQTGVRGVYAVGDILGPDRIMLAHVASREGIVAADRLMGADAKMDYAAVPGAIFTSPEVANVGLTESRAREQGRDIRADSVLMRTLGKAQVMGDIAGQAKIVSEAGSGRVLGVHLVGARATELIAEAALAVRLGASVTDLAETIHAHPTLAEIMPEAAYKALDMALHAS